MALLNYSTTIPASKTAAEIQRILAQNGTRQILTEFDDQQRISAVLFRIDGPGGEALSFRLPVDTGATYKVLLKQYNNGEVPRRYADEEHARRVAWRIIKDWLQAQMALLETEMVKMEEIFLPYLIVGKDKKTLYQAMKENQFLLPSGESFTG